MLVPEPIAADAPTARRARAVAGLGQAGVGVALGASEGAPPERAIVVGVEPEAPHHVTSLRMVRIAGPGGP